tara:strand:- start:217 stop:732 length:516 start_codon:yes stop_codon:yes gene_type:complete
MIIKKRKLLIDNKFILFDSKYLLIILTSISVTYSLYIKNKENDKYIFPFLSFINIGILLFFTIKYKVYNILHLLSFIGILYLLIIYDYKKFKLTNGELNDPDKYWIYLSILILLIYYLTMNSKMTTKRGKIVACLLIVYPLLFPIQEYFIHRIYSLLFAIAINLYFFKSLE